MKTPAVSITVTEAARNFSDCINRARYQGTTFILHKNGVAVARIVPEPGSADLGPDLQTDRSEKRSGDSSKRGKTGSRRSR